MRPFFINCEVELYDYTEKEEYDVYGEPIVSYEKIGTYPCDFQALSNRDSQLMFGKILTDTFKLFLDIDVPITDKMMVKKVGEEDTYVLIGSPQRFDHFLKHQEITIQKTRKQWELTSQ